MDVDLREVIALDDTQKFKNLLYGKDGTYKLDDQFLTQHCALSDYPGSMILSIAMGQPVNLDGDEMAPLNCSSFSGSIETAVLLIEAGAHMSSVYKRETPIMLAIRLSSPVHVRVLLQASADLVPIEYAARHARVPAILHPFLDNGDKNVAVDEAVGAGRLENVRHLLDHGGEATLMTLLVACSYNLFLIVWLLLDRGVIADDVAMQTCIYWDSMEALR